MTGLVVFLLGHDAGWGALSGCFPESPVVPAGGVVVLLVGLR